MIKRILLLLFMYGLIIIGYAQQKEMETIKHFKEIPRHKQADFKSTIKKKGLLTKDEWRVLIDQRWGEGLSTEQKLQIFDNFWNSIDQKSAVFPNLDINWEALKNRFRPEIEAGISRGRFTAIINYLSRALNEGHAKAYDKTVSNDVLEPGVPLMKCHGLVFQGHFGAALTPLADSTLLVYNVVQNHPLGLQPGDRILGYEGHPWKTLFRELLSFELPLSRLVVGSTRQSSEHFFLTAAGENWHLFDTIDVIKYGATDTLHMSTELMTGKNMELIATEQVAVPGIPFPEFFPDFSETITWGIVEGTEIGYIYSYGWLADFNSQRFEGAVKDLMYNKKTKGLILDTRFSEGGQPKYYTNGLRHLFNYNEDFMSSVKRTNPSDHFGFSPAPSSWEGNNSFKATKDIYDKPIAILTGPAAFSAADLYPMTARKHPFARTFGKPTNGAFSGQDGNPDELHPEWYFLYPTYTDYLLESPGEYLTHTAPPVDEEVWLQADDVANGEDTVVKRAIEWITNKVYPHSAEISETFYKKGTTGSTQVSVENPNSHNLSVQSYLYNSQSVLIDSFSMVNIDSGFYYSEFTLKDSIDDFHFDYRTTDLEDGDAQWLPYVSHFTTKGPVENADSLYIDANYNETTRTQAIFLILQNKGTDKEVTDLIVSLSTADKRIEKMIYATRRIPNLDPGEKYISTMQDFFTFKYAAGFTPDSTFDKPITFEITVTSKGFPYWQSSFDFTADKIVSIADNDDILPEEFSLFQNYPNPFNPITKIEYSITAYRNTRQHINLSIYNLLGQKVATLVNKELPEGHHKVLWDASGFPSGVYFYTLQSGRNSLTRKLLLLK